MVDANTARLDEWNRAEFVEIESMHWDENRGGLVCAMSASLGQVSALKLLKWGERTLHVLAEVSLYVAQGSQPPFRAAFSPLSRHALVQTDSATAFISRELAGSSIGIFSFATNLSTVVDLPHVIALVAIPSVQLRVTEANPSSIYMSVSVPTLLHGVNFGNRNFAPSATVDGDPVHGVQWTSDTAVTVTTNPRTIAGAATLTLVARGNSDSIDLDFTPSWHALTPTQVPARGGGNVTIVGAGFELASAYVCSFGGQIGSGVAIRGEVLSTSRIKCASPPWTRAAVCSGVECHTDVSLLLYREPDGEPRSLVSMVPGAPSIRITAGQAAQLRVVQSPSVIIAGMELSEPFAIAVQDVFGRNVRHSNFTVSARSYGSASHNLTVSGSTLAQTVDGVAIFSDLRFQTATNMYALQFEVAAEESIAPLLIAVSAVSFGSAAALAMQVQPAVALGGTPFGVMPQVSVVDEFGNLVRDWRSPINVSVFPNSTLALVAAGNWSFYGAGAGGCCRVSGTISIVPVNGTAVFTDISVDRTATGYQLLFSSAGLAGALSAAFTVTPGPAASLYMVRGLTPPGSLFLAMEPLSPPPEIHVLDAGRNLVPANLSINVTLSSDDSILSNELGDDILIGDQTMMSEFGVAVFSNLLVVKRRFGYFLTFQAPGLERFVSWSFSIRPAAAVAVGVQTQPSDGTATLPLSRQPVAAILDAGNNTAYENVVVNASVWIAGAAVPEAFSENGGFVTQLQVTAAVGTARFAGMAVAVASQMLQLRFDAAGLRPAYSDPISVSSYRAVGLFIAQEPGGGSGGLRFQQQPLVEVVDIAGNVVLRSSAAVAVSLLFNGQPATLATLAGTTVLTAVNGTAEFSDLVIDLSAAGYTLNFSSPGLGAVVSGNVSLDIGLTTSLTIFVQPDTTSGGERIRPAPRVCATDAGSNINIFEASLIVHVNISVLPTPGANLSGTTAVVLQGGCATFPDLVVDLAGQGYVLTFSTVGLTSTASDPFDVEVGAPAVLIVLVQPSSGTAVLPLPVQPQVEARDRGGNRAVSANATVVASLVAGGADTLSGVTAVPLILGIASYDSLGVVSQGTDLQLHFSVGNASVVSALFNVSTGDVVGIAIGQQPGNGLGGEALFVQPTIRTVDSGGNTVPSSGEVSVSLGPGPPGALLSGALTSSIVDGVATFTDLSVDLAASGHTLSFCYPAEGCFFTLLTPEISNPFNVSVGPKYRLTTTPLAVDDYIVFGGGEPPGLVLELRDRGGNVVADAQQQATIQLWSRTEEQVLFDCNGTLSCLTTVSVVVPDGERMISALLSIDVACTDFDFSNERISSLQVGSHVVTQAAGLYGGPWPGCYGDCSRFEPVVTGFETAPYFDGNSVTIRLQSTAHVNYNPCDGNYIRAVGVLRVLRAIPIEQALLQGPTTVAFNGSIALPSLAITTKAEAYMLSFNGPGVLEGLLYWIEVIIGSPHRIVMVQHSSNSSGGRPFAVQPIVQVHDAGGNLALGFQDRVSASLLLNGSATSLGQLWGNTTLNATNGTVVFTDLAVDKALSGYSIQFSSAGLISASSDPFAVHIGPAVQVSIVSQPLFGYGGQPFFRQPVVAIGDAGDNVILGTFAISASILVNGGVIGELAGGAHISTDAQGIANFTDLAIDRSGRGYTLRFETDGLAPRESDPFNILVGPAASLQVFGQPRAGTTISDLSVQPSVSLVDAGGNTVLRPSKNVTVRLYPYPSVGGPDTRLEGDTVQTTVDGTAWFYNLRVVSAASAWQLEFNTTDGAVGTVLSDPFVVSVATGFTLGEGQVTLLGTTPNLFLELEQYLFVRSLADALAVSVNDVRILGTESFSFRRRLLENGVVVQFDVVLVTTEQQRLFSALTASSLRSNLIQNGLLLSVQDLFKNAVGFEPDEWNGWWVSNASTIVALSYDANFQALTFFSSNAADGEARACQGSVESSNVAVMACYDDSLTAIGGATFTLFAEGAFSAEFMDRYFYDGSISNVVSFTRFEMLFPSDTDPAQLVEREFVVAASLLNGTQSRSESVLYLLNVTHGANLELEAVQRLETVGAIDIAHHRLFGIDYLFVASHFDSVLGSYSVVSSLYAHDRLDGALGTFNAVQTVQTEGAADVEAFRRDDMHFFAVANYYNGSSYFVDSAILQLVWLTDEPNGAPDLVTTQTIPTAGARSIKHLMLDGQDCLLIANEANNSVVLLRWSRILDRFARIDSITVDSPRAMAVFEVGGETFAAVTSSSANSTAVLSISMDGALSLHHMLSTGPADDVLYWMEDGRACLGFAFSPEFANPSASTGVFCSDAAPPSFSLRSILPTNSAGALMFYESGSAKSLFAGNGWGSGIEAYQPTSDKYTREGTHLEIALVPTDPVEVWRTLTAVVQLYNDQVPATLRSNRTVRLASSNAASLWQEVEAPVGEDGFAIFRDFAFLDPCVNVTLQFAAPFITGVSSRQIFVEPGEAVPAKLTSHLLFSVAPNASLFPSASDGIAVVFGVNSTDVSLSADAESPQNASLAVIVRSEQELERLQSGFNATALSSAIAAAGLPSPVSVGSFDFSSSTPPPESRLALTGMDLGERDFAVVGRPVRFDFELQKCSGSQLKIWSGQDAEVMPVQNTLAALPLLAGAKGVVGFGSVHFEVTFAIGATAVELEFALAGFESARVTLDARQHLRSHGPLPLSAALDGSSAVVVSDKLLVFGGNASAGPTNSIEAFDLITFQGSTILASAEAPSPRYHHFACAQDEAMFIFGGANASNPNLAGFFKYAPNTNTWTDLSRLSGQPEALERTEIGGTQHVVLVHGGSGTVELDIPLFAFFPELHIWQDLTYSRSLGLSPLVVGPLHMGTDPHGDNAYFVQDASLLLVLNTSSLTWSITAALPNLGPSRSSEKIVIVLGQRILVAELGGDVIQGIYILFLNATTPYWFPVDIDPDVSGTLMGPGILLSVNELRFLYVGATTEQITLQDGHRLELLWDSVPSFALAGEAFSPPPAIRVLDSAGDLVPWAGIVVSADIRSSNGQSIGVGGSVSVTAVDGVATFADLRPVGVADSASVLFYAVGLQPVRSAAVEFLGGQIDSMVVVRNAIGIFPWQAFFVQPALNLVDSQGNVATSDSASEVFADLREWQAGSWQVPAAASLQGNLVARANRGLLEWTDLAISGPGGAFALVFARFGIPDLTLPLNYTTIAESQLLIDTEPRVWQSGALRSPEIRVMRAVRGRAVPDNSTVIHASMGNNTGPVGAVLSGVLNATLSNGVAVFDSLRIDLAGEDYRILLSTADGALSNLTVPFSVVPATAISLQLMREPNGATGGSPFETQPRLEILDKYGNRAVLDSSTTVSAVASRFYASDNSSVAMRGHSEAYAEFGIVQFTDLAIDPVGIYSLSFTAHGLNGTNASEPLIVTAGPPASVVVLAQPSDGRVEQELAAQPVLGLRDRGGNMVNASANGSRLLVEAFATLTAADVLSYPALELLTTIPAATPLDLLHVSSGQRDFVLVANEDGDSWLTEFSDGNVSRLQGVATSGAVDWGLVDLDWDNGTRTLLVVANFFDELVLGYDVPSQVYAFDPDAASPLALYQNLSTSGAYNLQGFAIGSTSFLAIASHGDGTLPSPVDLFVWDGDEFDWYQSLDAQLPFDLEYYHASNDDFLAIADHYNFTTRSTNTNSAVFRWQNSRFVLWQLLPTVGATSLGSFQSLDGGPVYLVVANYVSVPDAYVTPTSTLWVVGGDGRLQLVQSVSQASSSIFRWEPLFSAGVQMVAGGTRPVEGDEPAMIELYRQFSNGSACSGCLQKIADTQIAPPGAESVMFLRAVRGQDYLLLAGGGSVSIYALFHAPAIVGNTSAYFLPSANGTDTARFTDLAVNNVGSWSIRFDAFAAGATLASSTSSPFSVAAGSPAGLSIRSQPSAGFGGAALSGQPVVEVVDGQGNPVLSPEASGFNVSVRLIAGNSSAQLRDAASTRGFTGSTVQAISEESVLGVALFASVAVDIAGEAFRLNFTSVGLGVVVSDPFDVSPGPPAVFEIASQPGGAVGGDAFGRQPTLLLRDAGGNVASNATQAAASVQLAVDPTGVAALSGSVSASSSTNKIRFSDLAIGSQSGGYQLEFQVWVLSNNSMASIPPFTEGGNVSEPFPVTVGPASALRAEGVVVARGLGVTGENSSVSLRALSTFGSDYFVGFLLRLSDANGTALSRNPLHISEQDHDNATGNISVRLLAPRDADIVSELDVGAVVQYELLSPAGFTSLSIWNTEFQHAAHGTYEVSGSDPAFERSRFRQQSGSVLSVARSGAPAVSGLYGRIPTSYNGGPVYYRQGGSLFLFSSCEANASSSPIADTTSCWSFASQVGGEDGHSALRACEAELWNNTHYLSFDAADNSWQVRVVGNINSTEVVLSAPGGALLPWAVGQRWHERNGSGVLVLNPAILVAPVPTVEVIDKGGNVVQEDSARSTRARIVLPTSLSADAAQPLQVGARSVSKWRMGSEDWIAVSRFSNTDTSCGLREACGGGFDLPVEVLRWDDAFRTHALAVIHNGDLYASDPSATCPDGWECNGTVAWDIDRSAGFPSSRNPQSHLFFGEASPATGPGVRLGPGTASVWQPVMMGAASSDSVLVTFYAALDWDVNSTSRIDGTLGQLSVKVDGVVVFGPVTPGPFTSHGMQPYSFRYTHGERNSSEPAPMLQFVLEKPSSLFPSADPAMILAAIDFTAHESTAEYGRWVLDGSAEHSHLHGTYTLTDMVFGGKSVFWRQAVNESTAGDARDNAASLLLFWASRGVWMVVLESGVDSSERTPALISAGALTDRAGPWREVLGSDFTRGADALFERDGERAYSSNANVSLRSPRSSLERVLQLPAAGALDTVAIVMMDAGGSEVQALAVANFFDGTIGSGGYQTASFVYKLEDDGSSFELLQSIATFGAVDVEAFRIGGESWLSIANFYDGDTHALQSPLLRWEQDRFEVRHSVPTVAALQWKHVQCGAQHLLLLLEAPPSSAATVRVWKLEDSELLWLQNISATGGSGLAAAEVEGACLLVVTADCDGCSELLRFQGAEFVRVQRMETVGRAVGSEFVFMAGRGMVAVSEAAGVRLFEARNGSLAPFQGFQGSSEGRTGMAAEDPETAGVALYHAVRGESYFVVPSAEETLVYRVLGRGMVGGQEDAIAASASGRVSWANVAASEQLSGAVMESGWEFSADGVQGVSIAADWEA